MPTFPITNGVETFTKPPEGYVVDFDHPQQQYALEHYLIFGIGGPIAFIALMQRFYTKIWLCSGCQVDDALMFLGWITAVTTQVIFVDSISRGAMCAHAWEMPLPRFETYLVISYIGGPLFMMCNGFSKLSLLAIYLQLSPQKWFRTIVWICIVFVSFYTAIITFLLFIHCSPIQKAYNVRIDGGTCIDVDILYMSNAAANVVTDVTLFTLPIPMIVTLRMGVAQKFGAMLMFAIGSMTVATSVIKLILLPPLFKSTDFAWAAAPANVWSFVEANLFVICGSMPTLRKFCKHFMPKIMKSAIDRSDSSYLVNLSTPSDRTDQAQHSKTTPANAQQMYHEELSNGYNRHHSLPEHKDLIALVENPGNNVQAQSRQWQPDTPASLV